MLIATLKMESGYVEFRFYKQFLQVRVERWCFNPEKEEKWVLDDSEPPEVYPSLVRAMIGVADEIIGT